MKNYLTNLFCKNNIIWTLIITLVPVLSLWRLLFYPGLYSYSDQHFPLSLSLPPYFIISPTPNNPFNNLSFDRLFISWPYYLFSALTHNLEITERLFFYYTFFLYSILCYLFATLTVTFYSEKINQLKSLERQWGKLIIFIFAYSNFSALNLNADGGTLSDSIILILLSISIMLILKDSVNPKTYLIIAGLMLLSFLLDPDYVPMIWLTLLIVPIVKTIIDKKEYKRIIFSLLSILISIISIIFLYLQSEIFSSPSVQGFQGIGYRAYSPGDVSFFSHNITPFNVLILFGHFWSTITYAPPSVIFSNKIPYLNTWYYPSQVIVVPGPVFGFWFLCIISIPLIAFSTLMFRSTRKTVIPLFVIFIIAYLISEEWNYRFVYETLLLATRIPIFGDAIGTSLALPGHFINIIAYIYLPLFSLGALNLIYYSNKISVKILNNKDVFKISIIKGIKFNVKNLKSQKLKLIISLIIITIFVSTSGWQAFNGSYYPMRAYPGNYLIGNNVEPKGVFSPTIINQSVIEAYNIVVKNYTENYNSLWIGGPSENLFAYAQPPNSISESSFSYLAKFNLWYDAVPYLYAHSVRFVVVTNEDISKNVSNPFQYFGFNNFSQAVSFFKESGLKTISLNKDVYVFELPNISSPLYYTNFLVNTSNVNEQSGILYKLFNLINYNISFSKFGASTGFDNASNCVDVIDPTNIMNSGIIVPDLLQMGHHINNTLDLIYVNSTLNNGHIRYYQNHSDGDYIKYLPGNFTTTSWSGNTSFYYDDGSLYSYGHNSYFDLGFNGSMTGFPGGFDLTNAGTSSLFNIKFGENVSASFRGSAYICVIGEGENASIITYDRGFPINVSNKMQNFQFINTLPPGTKYIGFRIGFSNFTGSAFIKYVNITAGEPANVDKYSPFGCSITLNNTEVKLPPNFSKAYFLYMSNNYTINKIILNQNNRITHINGKLIGTILIKNNTIRRYLGYYAVINTPLLKSEFVKYRGETLNKFYLGFDGSYIFPINGKGKISIYIQSLDIVYFKIAYALIISISFSLIILGLVPLGTFKKIICKRH